MCPLQGYRKRGFYFSETDFRAMTFEMEDIFAQLTLEAFKNETKFSVKEVKVKDASRTPRAILLAGSCDLSHLALLNKVPGSIPGVD